MYLEDISRASIWWKYLDHNSILPPPFTLIFLFHSAVKKIRLHCQVGFADVNIFVFLCDNSGRQTNYSNKLYIWYQAKRNEMDKEDRSEEKRQFNKRWFSANWDFGTIPTSQLRTDFIWHSFQSFRFCHKDRWMAKWITSFVLHFTLFPFIMFMF